MKDLTEEQQAVYDRQLRVWGLEAQRRMNSSRILIAGLGGLGAELSKNLALAGVGHLTVLDDRTYVAGDLSHGNFLVSASTQPGTPLAEATAASLQEMNPFIEVKGVSGRIDDTDKGAAFVEGFELVIAIGYGLKEAIQIDEWCSKAAKGPIKFFYARPRGPSCFLFAHMGSKHTWHTATAAAGSGAPAQFTDDFCSLETALLSEAGEAALERRTPDLAFIVRACAGVEARAGVPLSSALLQECQAALTALQSRNKFASKVNAALLEGWASIDSEYAPVSAVCGGILGQEVVRAISGKGQVFQNCLFYSLADGHGKVVCLGAERTKF